ncbi:MAG TPA: YciI family protein [Gammaproteobacteria bacterium]|nr:YciI family protein [Gammaproteobacteria bacterium]
MRFMIMVRATNDIEAGKSAPESLFAEMAAFHEQLAKAGVLLDAAGLQPSAKGWRIRYVGDQRTLVDGPFAEAKELIAGYTLIETKTREEALEWARRYPNPAWDRGVAEIEVRQLFDLEDFEPSPAIERFRDIGMGAQS